MGKEAGINRKEARSIGIAVDHRRRKTKAGDAESADLDKAQQLTGDIIPVPSAFQKPKAMAITDAMKEEDVFHKVRMIRADMRLFGTRQKNRLVKAAKES